MVIHTKEKSKLHVKSQQNVLTRNNTETARENPVATFNIRQPTTEEKLVNRKIKQKKQKKDSIQDNTISAITSVGAKATLDQLEGGEEVYESYMVAKSISHLVESVTNAGKRVIQTQTARAKESYVKKAQTEKVVNKNTKQKGITKPAKEVAKITARKTTQEAFRSAAKKKTQDTVKEATKKVAKETVKSTEKATASTAGTVSGTATTGAGGILVGAAMGEVTGIILDRKEVKRSTRNRMIQLFTAKLQQEENQDSVGKALKDIVMLRFSMATKYLIRYVGLFLLILLAVVTILTLPVIAILAVIYSSPYAIFFPAISSTESMQSVLSGYVTEFNRVVDGEVNDYFGYDASEKIYVDFEGAGIPDNYYDILAVYMVKYGNGDTATDMTEQAKSNLKGVFDTMCSYSVTEKTEESEDAEGNIIAKKVKQVIVDLKDYHDMLEIFALNEEEQAMLLELMKPEYMAMIGYEGGGFVGEIISSEQYQAIVDAVSDENGKLVVQFVLSKVGYPYSQPYRDSGDYYDCSSLAYYAWQSAGVSIMYEGANTAAAEGEYCYQNNYLVNEAEIQPGDLIFYSYSNNGRFMNITHVAVYVGEGMVVEAANESIGVVYREIQNREDIVFIGRPR